ncbi:hypothetical protein ACOQFV_03620 [Nocardiopsis changdeensis]|uniref:Alkaline shock response membrane anchor protein AmaP n=1 Tax=Nocardiopsis changdeensis TaxID=2831969 RepID=A0ABX8BKD8_9ACTN|nr:MULTISPECIES: hypothetical protein [Nocardiopsis]QUX22700.1 hypothetical protein KGD84_31195 [Nocardiopsis changdeensis]QYX38643.1 hypothetical protein K1J57_08570 [Nocardiopsis sp. MT53]
MTAIRENRTREEDRVQEAVSAERGPARRPFRGAMRRSRLNRALSFALGAALIAAGALGAAGAAARAGVRAAGGLDLLPRLAPSVPPQLLPYAVAAVGLAAVLLGVWWLLAQRDTGRLRRLVRGADSAAGLTVLSGNALGDAVAEAVERVPGAVRARARLHGPENAPWLRLEAVVSPDTDLREFLDGCRETAVEPLRMSLGVPAVPTLAVVAVGGESTRKVL